MRSSAILLCLAVASQAGTNYRASGDDHFYNLEYDAAIQDYAKLIEQNPADPLSYNDLASAHLYRELYRLGLLDSSALGRNNSFLRQKPPVDPNVITRVNQILDRGRQAAESTLAQDAHNKQALYALCANNAVRANEEFMLERAWYRALRSASRAKGYCDQVLKLDPNYVDAYLMPGIFEYVAGSLPLPVKMLASIGGFHGSKKKGIEMVERVAREGNYERDSARALLAILYRRERRPMDAARQVEALYKQYPRDYLFLIELASMYEEAGQSERALTALKSLSPQQKQRIPQTVRKEIAELEARLQTPAGQPGLSR